MRAGCDRTGDAFAGEMGIITSSQKNELIKTHSDS